MSNSIAALFMIENLQNHQHKSLQGYIEQAKSIRKMTIAMTEKETDEFESDDNDCNP